MKYRLSLLLVCTSLISYARVQHVRDSKQLKGIIDKQPTVIKFSATWCGPCQMAKKPFEEISDKTEFSHIAFVGIDTDQQQAIANAYNVTALPTFVFLRAGSTLKKVEGLMGAGNVSGFRTNLIHELNSLFTRPSAQPETPEEPLEVTPKKNGIQPEEPPLQEDDEAVERAEPAHNVFDQLSQWVNDAVASVSNAWKSFWQ